MVTLRRDRMYEFFDRLVNVALPRVRDFKGVSPKAFDGKGNYTLGIREQIIFPEINYDKVEKIKGMNITIVTTATQRRGRPRAAPLTSACPSAQLEETTWPSSPRSPRRSASRSSRSAPTTAAPLCGRPRAYPPQVPDVPHLLPQARADGRDHGRHQVELVGSRDFGCAAIATGWAGQA